MTSVRVKLAFTEPVFGIGSFPRWSVDWYDEAIPDRQQIDLFYEKGFAWISTVSIRYQSFLKENNKSPATFSFKKL